jgi:hypothetical protein
LGLTFELTRETKWDKRRKRRKRPEAPPDNAPQCNMGATATRWPSTMQL